MLNIIIAGTNISGSQAFVFQGLLCKDQNLITTLS